MPHGESHGIRGEPFMGILLIVTRGRGLAASGQGIAREEWLQLVEEDSTLRLRSEPFSALDPETGETILVPSGDAQAEFKNDGGSVPFLAYRRGELVMNYASKFEDPDDPVRIKIAEIAERLCAVITHDAGDEILEW